MTPRTQYKHLLSQCDLFPRWTTGSQRGHLNRIINHAHQYGYPVPIWVIVWRVVLQVAERDGLPDRPEIFTLTPTAYEQERMRQGKRS